MKRFYSLLLIFTLLFTYIVPIQSIYASDFRWVDISVGAQNRFSDGMGGTVSYSYKNGVYTFEYYIETDFIYNKDANSIIGVFSQAQLGDRITKQSNFTDRKMQVYINLNDLNSANPKVTIYDFKFTDINEQSQYNTEVTLISYEDYIDSRRVFLAKDKDGEYVYVAFSTKSGIAVPSIYSTDTYKVQYGEEQPYKGKHLYLITALEKTTIDKDNKDLYDPTSKTYAGELTTFYMKDIKNNTISYVFTESNSKDQYIVQFSLDKYFSDYYGADIDADITPDQLDDLLIDEYQEGRKISITGYIEGSTEYKNIIIVENFTYLEDNFTRYDKENVFIEGEVLNSISTEIGRDIYEIKETKTNLIYYAIFEKNVLGNSMPKNTLSGRKITLHGIVDKKNDIYYIGVLSYGLPEIKNTFSDNSNYNIKEVSISTVLSENNNEVLYKGIDSNGLSSSYLFSTNTLGNNMPKTSLLNKTLNIAYASASADADLFSVLAWTEVVKNNQDYSDKGVLLKRVQDNDDSAVYNFQNSYGEIILAILPKTLEKTLLEQKKLKSTDTLENVNVSLFGSIVSYDTSRRFAVKDANILTELYINKTTADVFTFNGKIDSVVSETSNGITYHAKNSYNQYALLYFSKDTLLNNFPKTSLLNKNMVVRGLTYSNGIILVTDYNEVTKMNTYPTKIEPLYSEPDHFSNMVGFTGVLSLLQAESGKTYITLITSSQRYLLSFESSLQATLENYIGNMVYLRGEPHPVGNPIWSGSIDVYDISPVCYTKGSCDTFIKPVNTPAPAYQDDGQKKAVHTIQENGQIPAEYEYGKAILESLFLPKFILSDEVDFFKK